MVICLPPGNPDDHLVDTFQRNLSLLDLRDYVIPLGKKLFTQWHEQQPWPWPGGLVSLLEQLVLLFLQTEVVPS